MWKSEHSRFLLLTLVCFVLSLGGIATAIYFNSPTAGGLGGAVAVAVSFAALFLTRDYGALIHELITVTLPAVAEEINQEKSTGHESSGDPDVATIKERGRKLEAEIAAITARLRLDAAGQRIQNRYLAFSAVVGTLSWAFGEFAARVFLSSH